MRSHTARLWVLAAFASTACRVSDDAPQPAASASAIASRSAPKPAAPRPPQLPAYFSLELPGTAGAFVSAPRDDVARAPLIVALHGNGDRPEYSCGSWRAVVDARAWIVCPRGKLRRFGPGEQDYGYYLNQPIQKLADHVHAAVSELQRRHAGRIDGGEPMLAGFSMGAIQAVMLAARETPKVSRLALVEGGFDQAVGAAHRLRAAGVRRVLLGSGTNGAAARRAAAQLQRSGLDARAAHASVGHVFYPPLQRALQPHYPWWRSGTRDAGPD